MRALFLKGRPSQGRAAAGVGVALVVLGLALGLVLSHGQATAASGHRALTLMTWNLEWLLAPEADRALRTDCRLRQPRSDEHALPCTPGRKPPPQRQTADYEALARTAQTLLSQGVDVIALQEVDGAQAARTVFGRGWVVDCFLKRAHPQKNGFAIREGIPYRCNGDLQALDIDGGSRGGADVSLYPGTPHEVRLLSVHLKSGCFDGKLDRRFAPCAGLRTQVPILEAWVDARVRERVAFAVLGDFNRKLDRDAVYPAGPDEQAPLNLMAAISDDQPRGAVLTRATDRQRYVPCTADDEHSRYIDDVLVSARLLSRASGTRFMREPYASGDQRRQLSDHCPLGLRLDGALP
ncbi:MAG: endonuclease/exonuclease/phosphatase family protein [Rubrivivax sp.]|nr:MAG: endonuclease/exonuclease/phosphatase family protein [Rubrivivax sp.]